MTKLECSIRYASNRIRGLAANPCACPGACQRPRERQSGFGTSVQHSIRPGRELAPCGVCFTMCARCGFTLPAYLRRWLESCRCGSCSRASEKHWEPEGWVVFGQGGHICQSIGRIDIIRNVTTQQSIAADSLYT